ncbi:hypothetical protein HDU92_001906 [Lobulomyces angularis]|nr:hypothetical protein HDU92_001906 [Lobulomyces angularis]
MTDSTNEQNLNVIDDHSPATEETEDRLNFPTKLDIETSLNVFKYFWEFPEKKSEAATNLALRELFEITRLMFAPTKKEREKLQKEKKNLKKKEDQLLLNQSLIRTNRNFKLVGSNVTKGALLASGSENLEYPPKRGDLNEINKFIVDSDAKIQEDLKLQVGEAIMAQKNFESEVENTKKTVYFHYSRSCHICGSLYNKADDFYDQLCENCAIFNKLKRNVTMDLTGRIFLLTGARIKIGYCVCLKLLRMGATVLATTRFPHDAAKRLSKEEDFISFKDRIILFGLDFRDISMVHQFCAYVKKNFTRLDGIINNAAQTVRKPPSFYEHLIPFEVEELPEFISTCVKIVFINNGNENYYLKKHNSDADVNENQVSVIRSSIQVKSTSALMSQLELIPSDKKENNKILYPEGLLDRDDQQIDMSKSNSWKSLLGEISTVEMVECHAINTFVPFILISELTNLMKSTINSPIGSNEDKKWNKYVVNVSAMEGQFYRKKTDQHPHTNMAKAALNMLTRTSSSVLALDNIFMTSVDTGWITDENPIDQWKNRAGQPPPLDEVDACMRILDPILRGELKGEYLYGIFLKNYFPTRW